MERRIKGPMLNLKNIPGAVLDRICNCVTVRRPQQEGLQDKHVQRALQHFALKRRFPARHVASILHSMVFWRAYQSSVEWLAGGLLDAKIDKPRRTQRENYGCANSADCQGSSNCRRCRRLSFCTP